MNKLPKILLSETIFIERQYLVEQVAKTNQVSFATETNLLTSSKAINAGRMMVGSAEVHMVGSVGADPDGQRAIKDLEGYGIKPTYVTSTSKLKTGQVIVMTGSSGDSAITLYLEANRYSALGAIANINRFDFVYAATSMDLVRLNKLIKMATKSKVGVFLDFPNQQEKFDKSNLKNVDFSVPNRHEAELLLGTKIMTITDALKAASKLKGFTNGNVVITLDRDGCVIVDKKNSVPKHISTKNVKVVDTTGSGDIFRGILLVEYLKTGSLEKAAQKAVSFATKTCLVSGVDASIRYSQKNQ